LRVTLDCDIGARVGEDHFGFFAIHQSGDDIGIKRVAADQTMGPQPPDVAGATTRRNRAGMGELGLRRVARPLWPKAFD
jgi:hypothetical protein